MAQNNRISQKRMKKKQNTSLSNTKMINIFKVVLIVLTFIFYHNTIFNHFSMDDYHINTSNDQTIKGFAGIPEIFSTLYAEESGMAYGYRPMVRTSFAIEYQFTSGLSSNPYISHFINLLLYIIAVLLLYKVLRRLLLNYNIWFPFLITLLFMAHPTHTEVVASLKNRDVLLNFIFTFIAIWHFVKWTDTSKIKHIIIGAISYIFALLSKETAIAQLAVFPLVLYFFTKIKPKQLGILTSILVSVLALVLISKLMFLPEISREMKLWENPLIANDSFITLISTGLFTMWFYIKLLFLPYPLLYYYGYNMLPLVGWDNPFVIISLIINLAMLVYAIIKLKEKHILSFAILYFFINMSMYANIVAPVPGIVADRFVFFATISVSILVIWLLFKIFKIPVLIIKSNTNNKRIIWVSILVLLIIIPFGYYTNIRNTQWRTQYSLYKADMPHLWNSVQANNLYAHEIMLRVNNELAKPVNPYKFIIGMVNSAEKHYKQAVHLDSTQSSALNNLGIIYSKIHGNQAKIRTKSYTKQNKLDKAELEKQNAKKYFNISNNYFRKAIYHDPESGSAYFNFAHSFELQNKYDSSIVYFKKAIIADGGELVSMSRLANAYFLNNQINEAFKQNEVIIDSFPSSDMPFINMGNYAIKLQDTTQAVMYFEKAVELGTKPQVGKLLSNYYLSKGDKKKSDFYLKKSQEAKLNKEK